MSQDRDLVVAVDIGGTFTDVVVRRGDEISATKVLTSHHDLPESVVAGLVAVTGRVGRDPSRVAGLFHATTIATNALLERAGARAGLITTAGFGDTLILGRGRRANPYRVVPQRIAPLIERELVEEVDERVDARGRVLVELDTAAVRAAGRRLRERGVAAVAVLLLHSYLNPDHERQVRELLGREGFSPEQVLLSSDVLPEAREYERGSTTAIAAYLAPVVRRYLNDLSTRLDALGAPARFWVMRSSGGLALDTAAAAHPEELVESGPAAGVIGTASLMRSLGQRRVISFDMGGTTAKAALVLDHEPRVNLEYEVGGASHAGDFLHKGTGHPLRVPVIDLDEVGTGGGSIAWIDAAGGLRVGPRSAGSDPGPACYGRGGHSPTVTDADLVLGYLGPGSEIGELDLAAATAAIEREVAGPLGCEVATAARGIVELAQAQMADVVRTVSLAKGHDPGQFSLVAFGGAGPLHACAIAARLGITRVFVPPLPGVHAALGLLVAGYRVDLSQAMRRRLGSDADLAPLLRLCERMCERAERLLLEQGHPGEAISTTPSADMRYVGQTYEVTVSLADAADPVTLEKRFHAAHEAEFGYRCEDVGVELTTVRVAGVVPAAEAGGIEVPAVPLARTDRQVYFAERPVRVPVVGRAEVEAGPREGPLIITQPDTSVVVPPGATVLPVGQGFLRIDLPGEGA